ncbi:hypothetical protein [Fusobacterium necrophorum]|uniref:hypothetical protein n=1 Tax=Fusobacterium necrophorum TaxID=859 RepID=UPI00370DEEF3
MSVTLASVFGSVVGKKVIDKVLDVIDKKIPMTNDEKEKLVVELGKIEVEGIRAQTQNILARNKFIQGLVNAMPLIGWILPLSFAFLIGCYLFQFGSDVWYSTKGMEAPIYNINKEYSELMKKFIEFLFYGKIAGKLSPFHDSDGTTGSKFLEKLYK